MVLIWFLIVLICDIKFITHAVKSSYFMIKYGKLLIIRLFGNIFTSKKDVIIYKKILPICKVLCTINKKAVFYGFFFQKALQFIFNQL